MSLHQQIGLADLEEPFVANFGPGVYFVLAYSSPGAFALDVVPIVDTNLLSLPFTLGVAFDRPSASATGQIRFVDGTDVAFSADLQLADVPAEGVDLRSVLSTFTILNQGGGDLFEVDLADLQVGRLAAAPEPAPTGLIALALGTVPLLRRSPRRSPQRRRGPPQAAIADMRLSEPNRSL